MAHPERGGAGEVFVAFLRLGLLSFGGPLAHLGYFRDAFVARRRWLDDAAYAELLALCQLLPGPASSQAGFAIGLGRGGLPGGLAAWAGFTLPSALLMLGVAWGAARMEGPVAAALVHGLKLVALAVVAQALVAMWRGLAADLPRTAIAAAAFLLAGLGAASGHAVAGQVGAIAAGAVAGAAILRKRVGAGKSARGAVAPPVPFLPGRRAGAAILCLAALLVLAIPALAEAGGMAGLAAHFLGAGAFVFGGGHVVLPLLDAALVGPGLVSSSDFLAAYGAAQALPGPLFAVAAALGAMAAPQAGVAPLAGAAVALVAIFLPGLLLVSGMLPFWRALRGRPGLGAVFAGANAATVGLIAAALRDPLWPAAMAGPADLVIGVAGIAAALVLKPPPWILVLGLVAAALAAAFAFAPG